MHICKIAIERPVTTVMLFVSVLVLGMVSLARLPVQFLPDISIPGMGCYTYHTRALGTEEQERRIIKPLENEIAQLAGVKDMWSYGWGGQYQVLQVMFEYGTNAKFRTVEFQERLDRFRRTLPRGSLFTFVFPFDSSFDNQNFMDIAVQGPRHDPYLQGINVERVVTKLQDIDGVARADTYGGHQRVVEVAVHEDRMREFNVPLYSLINTVRSHAAEPVFVGELLDGGQRHFVRVDGQFKGTHELGDLMVVPEGSVYLRHMAQVKDVLLREGNLSRVNGKPSLVYWLFKESGVNPLELSQRIRNSMDRIERTLPPGYSLVINWDGSELIRDLIQELTRLAGIGIVLAMMILHAFVRSVRMTLLVCIVIPISIIATFNLMYFSDMSINLLTLVGLAIGVGSLLDNSIVVLENISRHRQHGVDAKVAAAEGAREVARPIFALTLTSIIVFLPVVFVEGELQMIFREGALAVIYPLLVSMAVALLLVPMAASYLYRHGGRRRESTTESVANAARLNRGGAGNSWQLSTGMEFVRTRVTFGRLRSAYLRLLKGCLRHRVRLLLAIATVILYTWFYTMQDVNRGGYMRSPQDNNYFRVHVFPPQGSHLDHTTAVVDRVEDLIDTEVEEREIVRSYIEDDYASVHVELVDASERERTLPQVKEALRSEFKKIGEAEVSFEWKRQRGNRTPSAMVGGERGTIELKGPDQRSLLQIIDLIRPVIEQIDGIRDVYSDLERGPLELQFRLDRDSANLLQVKAQHLAWQLASAQSQGQPSEMEVKLDDEEIELVFQQVTEERDGTTQVIERDIGLKLSEIRRIPIFSPTLGSTVAMEDLGAFELVRQPYGISRKNRERTATVFYSLAPNAKFHEVERQVKAICDNYPLPAGFSFDYGGISEEFLKLITTLRTMVLLSLVLVYMLMASLFESFYQPFIILFTVVLAIVPIVWGLILTDTRFDFMAAFGAVLLVGLLPNSGILLVNFASAMRRENGFPRARAVFLACSYRLRPILMTVGTTALGVLPMAIATEGSRGEWVPFAVVVISGLLGSTILTLISIPGLYFVFEDLTRLLNRGVKFLLSLRWVFVFWSGRMRASYREHVTAYRRKEPREEPLRVQTWNLTRVYSQPVLERLRGRVRAAGRLLWVPRPAPVGLIAGRALAIDEEGDRERGAGTARREMALAGVNLEIERGVFGLLGPNGAGKTTLIRLLAGVDQQTRGTCHICGYDMVCEGAKAQHLVGYLPQDFGVYSKVTASEYLHYYALLKGFKDKSERGLAIDRALEMVNLSHASHVKVRDFSGGMMRRIGLAQIFLRPPRVLIVDEPTAGLDPVERLRFRNLLAQLAADRIVILSTHIVEDVEHSCRNLALLDEGLVSYCGGRDGLVDFARGHVCELLVDDRTWSESRRLGEVTSMQRTPEGLKLRLVVPGEPPDNAVRVTPTLEDAYVYYTVVMKGRKQ